MSTGLSTGCLRSRNKQRTGTIIDWKDPSRSGAWPARPPQATKANTPDLRVISGRSKDPQPHPRIGPFSSGRLRAEHWPDSRPFPIYNRTGTLLVTARRFRSAIRRAGPLCAAKSRVQFRARVYFPGENCMTSAANGGPIWQPRRTFLGVTEMSAKGHPHLQRASCNPQGGTPVSGSLRFLTLSHAFSRFLTLSHAMPTVFGINMAHGAFRDFDARELPGSQPTPTARITVESKHPLFLGVQPP